MRFFSSLSIRKKLMLLLTATASVMVFIACAILWSYQLVHYRTALRTEESAMAQLIAESSGPALLFSDAAAANETLAVLRADPRIETACLYDKHGAVVARYGANNQAALCPKMQRPGVMFTRAHLLIFRAIEVQHETVGSLYLDVSLAEMLGFLLRFSEIILCVLVATSIFALGLSSLLERAISKPILHLTRVAGQVSDQNNYLLRAQRFSDDESGLLIDQFNAMMDRIQQREADLQHAHASLEDKVRMRTQDLRSEIAERKLIERDLKAAKFAAEESNRSKSAFLANMSHELRTPLNAIIGYSEMLHEDAEAAGDTATANDLAKVLVSARHLLRLIGDVLDLSKIEAGQMKVDLEVVGTRTLLDDVLSTAEILGQKNHNILHVVEPIWEGELNVDSLRFRQCLLNLISNACKFTENGRISIAVEQQAINGSSWALWKVRDSGIGMSPEGIEKLFKTFSQVDGSNTRKYGGSGLGLAISQQLCEAMGGKISVESQPGVGSTFTIHMPSAASASDPANLQEDERLHRGGTVGRVGALHELQQT